MKQSAVEWLQEALSLTFEQEMKFEGLFQQAKEMEKQQQERSYSEEDIKLAFNEGYDVCRYVTDNTDEAKECFNEWFEQFKKK